MLAGRASHSSLTGEALASVSTAVQELLSNSADTRGSPGAAPDLL